jgi:hypothetical protein
VIDVSRSLAAYAIVVDATNEKAAIFCRNFGFTPFPDRLLRLFMPAPEVAAAHCGALLDSRRSCGLRRKSVDTSQQHW